jgi:hypothetical protein
MRRFHLRWLLCSLFVALLFVPALWLIFPNGSDRATWENFEKVQEGMTDVEVNNLFALPPLEHRYPSRGYTASYINWRRVEIVPSDKVLVSFRRDDGGLYRVKDKQFVRPTWRQVWMNLRTRITMITGW